MRERERERERVTYLTFELPGGKQSKEEILSELLVYNFQMVFTFISWRKIQGNNKQHIALHKQNRAITMLAICVARNTYQRFQLVFTHSKITGLKLHRILVNKIFWVQKRENNYDILSTINDHALLLLNSTDKFLCFISTCIYKIQYITNLSKQWFTCKN